MTDRFRDNHPVAFRNLVAGGIAGLVGSYLGISSAIEHNDPFSRELGLLGGSANITATYVIPPKECHYGYDDRIEGLQGRFDLRLKSSGISFANATETLNADYTNQLCNSLHPTKKIVTYNADTKKVTTTFAPDAFSVISFRKDLQDENAFKPGGSAVMVGAETFSATLRAIPGLANKMDNLKIGDELVNNPPRLRNKLRGIVEEEGARISGEVCGKVAIAALQKQYGAEVAETTLAQARGDQKFQSVPQSVRNGWTAADVKIVWPTNIEIHDQYYGQRQVNKGELAADGVVLIRDAAQPVECGNLVDAMPVPS